jgi:hypothetical protein
MSRYLENGVVGNFSPVERLKRVRLPKTPTFAGLRGLALPWKGKGEESEIPEALLSHLKGDTVNHE